MKQEVFSPLQMDELQSGKEAYQKICQSLQTALEGGEEKYACLLAAKNPILVTEYLEKFKDFTDIVLIGTGGSSLSAQVLYKLKPNPHKKFYFLENADPFEVEEILAQINPGKTAFLVISKSGETSEVVFLTQYVLKRLQGQVEFNQHFFLITEDKPSSLTFLFAENKNHIFEHPTAIGGRYSFFSIVGMLPAALMGWNIEKICNAGMKAQADFLKGNAATDFTLASLKLYLEGVNESIIMCYQKKWQYFGRWYRQLLAESLGKQGEGITPITALGSVDQHSQCQLYLDGPRNKFFTLIYHQSEHELDIFHHEQFQATRQALKDQNFLVRTIIFQEENMEESLGEFVMQMMMEVITLCLAIDVNPFDQQAVDQIKQHVKKVSLNA